MRLFAVLAMFFLSIALPRTVLAQPHSVGEIFVRGPIQSPPGEPPPAVLILTGVAGMALVRWRKRDAGTQS
jgi:hypothetical protein